MSPHGILSVSTFVSIQFVVTSLQTSLGPLGNLDAEVTPADSPYGEQP
jgi:hypothetical protein